MKPISITFFLLLLASHSFSQQYWQQRVDHRISAEINNKGHYLKGIQTIRYLNNSPDSLPFIWLHIWPNAYKNDRTAFSEQLLKNGRTDFYFSKPEEKGYIDGLDFIVNDKRAEWETHPKHEDIIKLILPAAIAPDSSVEIKTPFFVKLPKYFSRSGYLGDFISFTQWYPKPAVYDKNGWHPMPYLDQGEFYNEFGNYDVEIKAPRQLTVAATGQLKLKEVIDSSFIWKFTEENITDFAFFAGSNLITREDTVQLKSGIVKIFAYHRKDNKSWKNSLSYIKSAIHSKSGLLGDYPYACFSLVEKPDYNGDGMEYPTIALVSNSISERAFESLIHHEVGHNWFQAILASNERDYPWMDEGMNSYYDNRYNKSKNQYAALPDYGGLENTLFFRKRLPANPDKLLISSVESAGNDQPIMTGSEDLTPFNYDIIAYRKSAAWLEKTEGAMGRPLFDSMMRQYYLKWKFRHPQPEDFRAEGVSFGGPRFDSLYSLITKKSSLYETGKKRIRPAFLFNMHETDKKQYMSFLPALGYNYYDKMMVGLFAHNYQLPSPALKFFAAPLFSTGTKRLNGLASLCYSIRPKEKSGRLDIFISGSAFTKDIFKDSTGKKNTLPISKLVPGFRYISKPKGSMRYLIQWKTFFINETTLFFQRDTASQSLQISYPVSARYLNQLTLSKEDNRALYPYKATLTAEQASTFLRLNAELKYFLNYPSGGGLDFRMFAGKFIYLKDKSTSLFFETNRYHLNMTGPDGAEDYTYSHYFAGRNEFDGLLSRQIIMRDGGFKINSNLLSREIGKTDNWLAAINLATSIPDKLNPLSLLPFKLPLKIFADIGTNAPAWKKGSDNARFLYDAGLQLSLFGNILNIYAPLLYSKEFRNYVNSTIPEKKFFNTLSFSIDFTKFSIGKILPKELF